MNLILLQPRLKAFDDKGNFNVIHGLLGNASPALSADDIVLLPEHISFAETRQDYRSAVTALAKEFGCHIVGGSYHEKENARSVNTGVAVNAEGNTVGEYDKLRPYSEERSRVSPGDRLGEFSIAGRRILVLVCADFWFSDLFFRAARLPDLVLVPSLSVTRKPDPHYSRTLWKHLAVSRAYEFGCYVGISDWSREADLPKLRTAGVGGFADPTAIEGDALFVPLGQQELISVHLDFKALEEFRNDRRRRGFFWKDS